MKNKFLRSSIALLLISVMIVGCAGHGDVDQDIKPGTESSEAAVNSSTIEELSETEVEEDIDQTPTHFLNSEDGNYSYVIDMSGNCLQTVDNRLVKKTLEDKYDDADLSNIRMVCGNLAFCGGYKHYDWDSYVFYVENMKTKEADIFLELEDDYFNMLDYYKGNIYIYYNEQEYIYTFHDDLSYEVKESGLSDFFEATKDLDVKYKSGDICLSRQLDENGYVPAMDEDKNLYTIKKDGTVTKLDVDVSEYSYQDFDKYGIIFNQYDDDHNYVKTIIVDPETSATKEFVADEYFKVRGVTNGICYYAYEKETDVYMMDETYYYAYDMKTGENTLVYSAKRTPGTSYGFGYGDSYDTFNGYLYVADVVDGQGKWLRINVKDGGGEVKDTDCVYKEINAFKYGTVEYDYSKVCCEKCGKPLVRAYQEYFVLSDEFSEYADEINNSIKENSVEDPAKIFDYSDDDCSYHDQYTDTLTDTYEKIVWNVDIIKDHYLTVDLSYYSMGVGAAHGYGAGYMLVYDLDTGKKMGISDFFDGTEEEFKKLMAEKTVEYFNSPEGEERNSHDDIGDDESIYHNAYEQAGFDTTHLDFYEDHVTLVYYQYEIAYYAAGCFYIDIPYEDFHA